MNSIPPAAEPLIHELAGAFTRPTIQRSVILLFAAILTLGWQTVADLLRAVHARDGTHRDEYFFTTDLTMTPRMIVETFTGVGPSRRPARRCGPTLDWKPLAAGRRTRCRVSARTYPDCSR
ncbi:MAG: hypothetical protein JXQ75_17735 [Phycisphaerae bacterium]|nr:hypothetical protein [Phycisphaerae bacterium]